MLEVVPSIAALRHAPWSTSKVKTALRCTQEFHYRYVEKIAELRVGPELRIGKAVHAALEGVLERKPFPEVLSEARTELLDDDERARFDTLAIAVGKFGERIESFRARRKVRSEWVEHKLAVRTDLSGTLFHAKDAFFRGVWDAGFVFDDGILAVVDHKTGMRRPAGEFADQLEGYATLAAAHLQDVKRVWLGVHFVAEADMEWTAPVGTTEVRAAFAPRLFALIERAAENVAGPPVPQVTNYCNYCGYRPLCPAMRGISEPPRSEAVQLVLPDLEA
jgi:CRISPR/Cas system-associated exonuclease Cas4 (RecB family)